MHEESDSQTYHRDHSEHCVTTAVVTVYRHQCFSRLGVHARAANCTRSAMDEGGGFQNKRPRGQAVVEPST